ncbi:gliding motility-associated C-terminal domain-containing protein, partial [Bacteroidales bacterium OttesenSCG-928-L03]|nr:gliding motility-associated C-terminal domain-containing protein [Bacteroidales bacterium OttesenSCG-928-L03]
VTSHKIVGDSERKFDGANIYGDSAPYELSFQAYANEPVAALYRWRVDSIGIYNKERYPIVSGYNNKTFNFTFMEEAGYEVILEVIDRTSQCICRPDTTHIQIGSSELKVPNFFSPGTSIGQNDEFRIQYRSITDFRCRIYNRWGNLLYDWSDPTQGWDGRVNGRLVATGAYHYVIEYKDARGNKKSKTGTVNILRDVRQ